jgi:hypothetical protein
MVWSVTQLLERPAGVERAGPVQASDRAAASVLYDEAFGSTTVQDALSLGRRVLRQLIDRDLVAVYVTFVDELASIDAAVVSRAVLRGRLARRGSGSAGEVFTGAARS